jgi:hypothetical protein
MLSEASRCAEVRGLAIAQRERLASLQGSIPTLTLLANCPALREILDVSWPFPT